MKSEQVSESIVGDYYKKLFEERGAISAQDMMGNSEEEITLCEMVEKFFKDYYNRTLPTEIEAAITEHFGGCSKCREGFNKWLDRLERM